MLIGTTEHAAQHIGEAVTYVTASGGEFWREDGIITSTNDKFVFVRYGLDHHSMATYPGDLFLYKSCNHKEEKRKRKRMARKSKQGKCEWFALCDNPATEMVSHPVVGRVPTCERHADMVRAARTDWEAQSVQHRDPGDYDFFNESEAN